MAKQVMLSEKAFKELEKFKEKYEFKSYSDAVLILLSSSGHLDEELINEHFIKLEEIMNRRGKVAEASALEVLRVCCLNSIRNKEFRFFDVLMKLLSEVRRERGL